MFEGDDVGVLWPPKNWETSSPEARRDELLRLGQLLDVAWYGLQESRSDIEIGERYYAFTLPYSLKPGDDHYTDQAYDQDRFQTMQDQAVDPSS